MAAHELTDEVLTQLACGELSGDAERALLAQIAESPDVKGRYERLMATLGEMKTLRQHAALFKVSRDRIVRLQSAVVTGQSAPLSSLAQRARELVATLVFDSSATPVTGVRGAGSATSGQGRLLHLACENTRITIRIERDGPTGMLVITGEIQPPSDSRTLTVRESASGEAATVPISEDGFFELEIKPGAYALKFVGSDTGAIVIDRVDL